MSGFPPHLRPAPAKPGAAFINQTALARWLGVSRTLLVHWRSRNVGPPYAQPNSGLILYKIEDVAAWLDEHTVRAASHDAELCPSCWRAAYPKRSKRRLLTPPKFIRQPIAVADLYPVAAE